MGKVGITPDNEFADEQSVGIAIRKSVLHLGGLSGYCARMALVCPECGNPIDPAGPAVSGGRSGSTASVANTRPMWVPFIEDLRGGPFVLRHPRCFARTNGFDELMDLITRYERDQRLEIFDHLERNAELRRACLDLKARLQLGDAAIPPAYP